VELGANEANAGVAAATFQTNLNTLVGTLKALGNDVLLAKCHPAFPTSNSYNIPAGYLTAIDAVTTGQSIHAGVNFNTLPFVTPNDYYDNIHATKSGYAREASAAFAVMSA
jgi:lysophospholipase L1-like esterase